MKLFAVATLLDTDDEQFRRAWNEVGRLCELSGFTASKLPHVSWHVAENYEMDRVPQMLAEIAGPQSTISAHTVGLGVFSNEQPVLYLPVCKSSEILNFHQDLWGRLENMSQSSSHLYSPEKWMPHITLYSGKTDMELVQKAAGFFSHQFVDFEFTLSNIAIIYKDELLSGISSSVDFGGLR